MRYGVQQARRGGIFAAFLKLLPVFIFIIPGMICMALAQSGNAAISAELLDDKGQVVRENAQKAAALATSCDMEEKKNDEPHRPGKSVYPLTEPPSSPRTK